MLHKWPDPKSNHLLSLTAGTRPDIYTIGQLGYDGPLYDGLLSITDNMLGPSPMRIKYLSYVYDEYCI